MDMEKMPSEAQELWKELLDEPTPELKNLFFENYVSNCNVIGATCSSIGQKNIILSEAMESGKRNRFKPTNSIASIGRFSVKEMGSTTLRFDLTWSYRMSPAKLLLPNCHCH